MEIVEALDAGPILLQRTIPIAAEDTAGTLEDRLAPLGAEALIETLRAVERGEVTKSPQNEAEATYAPRLPPDIGRLEWSRSAGDLWSLASGPPPPPPVGPPSFQCARGGWSRWRRARGRFSSPGCSRRGGGS